MIPAGYYHRVQTMLNQIEEKANHVLKSTNSTINLNYDKISRKASMEGASGDWHCLPIMLGMTMVSSFANNQSKADLVVNMDPVDSFYVYCDVVEPREVGDKQVPLLRIIPAEDVRLQQKSFQTIKIDIRDRTGNIVPFKQGTLKVTLHFRQRIHLSTLWTWKAEACLCILEHPIREAMVSAVSLKTFSVTQLPFSMTTGKDMLIEFLLELLKEERDQRRRKTWRKCQLNQRPDDEIWQIGNGFHFWKSHTPLAPMLW